MYEIIIYKDENGQSELLDFLRNLKRKAKENKEAKVLFSKIVAYIDCLKDNGTYIGEPFVKHLDGDIWELRPLSNRILFAYYKDGKFILLHSFVKKTNKTPSREIKKAKRELWDYKRRFEKE